MPFFRVFKMTSIFLNDTRGRVKTHEKMKSDYLAGSGCAEHTRQSGFTQLSNVCSPQLVKPHVRPRVMAAMRPSDNRGW